LYDSIKKATATFRRIYQHHIAAVAGMIPGNGEPIVVKTVTRGRGIGIGTIVRATSSYFPVIVVLGSIELGYIVANTKINIDYRILQLATLLPLQADCGRMN